jgi:UDP-N-acetylmuramate--alanine ligase
MYFNPLQKLIPNWMTSLDQIQLENYNKAYFIGVGGIGMSALARYFHSLGWKVAGYDKTPSPLTSKLEEEGIEIHFEDYGTAIPEVFQDKLTTLVIYTPAIPKTMGELNYVMNQGFTLLKRSQVLGLITRTLKGLGVAGTHGKTTTSSLLAYMLSCSNLKCNAFLGGISTNFNSNLVLSENSEFAVIEADEFDRSFLQLTPFATIVTSTDADHLDIYGDAAVFRKGFEEYVQLVHKDGFVLEKFGLGLKAKAKTFSYDLNNPKADYQGENLRFEDGNFVFDFKGPGIHWQHLIFGLPGIHNAENAVACIAMCLQLGLSEVEIRTGLSGFKGVKRRFETHFKSKEFIYIDDYAHHPTELEALISSIRLLYPDKKITGIFQPHLFSRTKDFQAEFARELSKLDTLFLMPIYPAREEPIPGVTSEVLLDLVTLSNKKIVQASEILEACNSIEEGVVLTIGAGDIDRIITPLLAQIKTRKQ